MTLTKERLTESIYNNCGCFKHRSIKLVESLVEVVKSTLESKESMLISGFGNFCLKEKREQRGRNPETGEDMMLGARKVVTFRCSSALRDKINGEKWNFDLPTNVVKIGGIP